MHSLRKILLLVLLLPFALVAQAQCELCNGRNTSFLAGEKLTFKVFYNVGFVWIHAGTASFATNIEDINGQSCLWQRVT